MKQTFVVDPLGRIYLNEPARRLLQTEEEGEFYLHVKENQIILDKTPKDFYLITGVDDENLLALDIDILKYKMMIWPGDSFEADIIPGTMIIPLSEAQAKASIRYVRKVDEFGRAVIPYYIREKAGIKKGMHISWIKKEMWFYLKKNDKRKDTVDQLSMVKLPKVLTREKKVEFILDGEEVAVRAYKEKK